MQYAVEAPGRLSTSDLAAHPPELIVDGSTRHGLLGSFALSDLRGVMSATTTGRSRYVDGVVLYVRRDRSGEGRDPEHPSRSSAAEDSRQPIVLASTVESARRRPPRHPGSRRARHPLLVRSTSRSWWPAPVPTTTSYAPARRPVARSAADGVSPCVCAVSSGRTQRPELPRRRCRRSVASRSSPRW